MKKLFALYLVIHFCSILSAQFAQYEHEEYSFHKRNPKSNCNEIVQSLDSVIGYSVDPVSGIEVPEYVLRYTYNNDLCISTTKFLLPDYTPSYNQIFSYNSNGTLTEYVFQTGDGNGWKNSVKTSYFYKDELLSSEVFERAQADGTWLPFQQHFYENLDGRAISYLRQVKDSEGNWYDFSNHYFVYDDAGNLVVLYGEYIKNNLIYWRRTSNFNTEGGVIDRYLEVLRYDFDEGRNILKQELHQLFYYDIYSDISEIISETVVEGVWTETARLEYHRSLLEGKKVSVCHNGHTICVSADAVKAHLAHGDKLGSCDSETWGSKRRDIEASDDRSSKGSDIEIKIYPNPTDGKASIEFKNSNHGFTGVSLISSTGSQLDYFQIEGRTNIDIFINKLRSGSYLLRFSGEKEDVWKTIIKK